MGTSTINKAPAVKPVEFDVEALIECQQGMIRRHDYTPLGRLERLYLGSTIADSVENNPLASAVYADGQRVPKKLEWRGIGPLVGLSKDQQDVLFIGQCVHPPRLPRPDWVPPKDWVSKAQLDDRGLPIPPEQPMTEQRLRDRGAQALEARRLGLGFVVLQPVTQLFVILREKAGWATINCRADFGGRHAAFLFDPKREQAFLLFGLKEMELFQRG